MGREILEERKYIKDENKRIKNDYGGEMKRLWRGREVRSRGDCDGGKVRK